MMNDTHPLPTPSKMDPKIKTRWLEALRSDKYQQGKTSLRTFDNKYCCLGVLCDIINTDIQWIPKQGFYSFDGRSTIPSQRVLSLAKLSFHEAIELTKHNDVIGSSFHQIADYIEANL